MGLAAGISNMVSKRLRASLMSVGVFAAILAIRGSPAQAQIKDVHSMKSRTYWRLGPPSKIRLPGSAPLPTYAIIYVSPYGLDSNDGLNWGTAKATIAGAIAALPHCTAMGVKGGLRSFPCGTIHIGAGTIVQPTSVVINSPLVRITGAEGGGTTQIHFTGTGCALVFDGSAADGDLWQGPVLQNVSVDGSDNGNSHACGIKTEDLAGISLENVQIANFTAPGDAALISTAVRYWDERVEFHRVYLGNSTTGWLVQTPGIAGHSETTFGYANIDLYINLERNQTAVESIGTSQDKVLLSYDNLHIIVNSDSPIGNSCAKFRESEWVFNTGVWQCDGDFSSGFSLDSKSQVSVGGYINTGGPNTIAAGGKLWLTGISNRDGDVAPFYIVSNNTLSGLLPPSGVGTYFDYLPSASGTLALIGADGLSAGNAVLSNGSSSHSFVKPYSSSPVCVATDETTSAAVKVTSTPEMVSLMGNGNDEISWMCAPQAN